MYTKTVLNRSFPEKSQKQVFNAFLQKIQNSPIFANTLHQNVNKVVIATAFPQDAVLRNIICSIRLVGL